MLHTHFFIKIGKTWHQSGIIYGRHISSHIENSHQHVTNWLMRKYIKLGDDSLATLGRRKKTGRQKELPHHQSMTDWYFMFLLHIPKLTQHQMLIYRRWFSSTSQTKHSPDSLLSASFASRRSCTAYKGTMSAVISTLCYVFGSPDVLLWFPFLRSCICNGLRALCFRGCMYTSAFCEYYAPYSLYLDFIPSVFYVPCSMIAFLCSMRVGIVCSHVLYVCSSALCVLFFMLSVFNDLFSVWCYDPCFAYYVLRDLITVMVVIFPLRSRVLCVPR